jgi:hypothetical protein
VDINQLQAGCSREQSILRVCVCVCVCVCECMSEMSDIDDGDGLIVMPVRMNDGKLR